MLCVYIGIASLSVIIVSFLVDALPMQFVDADPKLTDGTKSEVRSCGQKKVTKLLFLTFI